MGCFGLVFVDRVRRCRPVALRLLWFGRCGSVAMSRLAVAVGRFSKFVYGLVLFGRLLKVNRRSLWYGRCGLAAVGRLLWVLWSVRSFVGLIRLLWVGHCESVAASR